MKKLLLGTAWIFWCGAAIGQSIENKVVVKNTVVSEPAASLYLPYAPEVVRLSLTNYVGKSDNDKKSKAGGYLSTDNTLIAKNNSSGADMHFLIGQKDVDSKNESIIFLKLNSFSYNTNTGMIENVQFQMKDAKAYLDNLAIAIRPFATEQQLKWQQKQLEEAKFMHGYLLEEKKLLDLRASKLNLQMNAGKSRIATQRLTRKKEKNDLLLSENAAALLLSDQDIARQTAALEVLLR